MTNRFTKLASAAVLAAAVLVPSLANAAEFTVVNRNQGASIQRVWVAEAGVRTPWREVYLDYAISPTSASRFALNSANRCMYDLKVQFSDGYTSTYGSVNVCRGDRAIAY